MAEADRTERATPRRREQARKHGQVAVSPEIAPVAVLLTAIAVAAWGAPVAVERSRTVLRGLLAASGPLAAHDDPVGPVVLQAIMTLGGVLVPFFLATAVVGAGVVIGQVGWALNPGLVLPDGNRISPANGFKRLFSANGAMNLVKAVAKITAVLALAYRVLLHAGADAVAAPDMTPLEILLFTGASLRRLALTMGILLAVLGALDYVWQRRRHERSLRMSRHEVKEEHKEAEGNPQVKLRFRRAHRELSRRRMLSEVRHADVVLTNPVHVAVALRYRANENAAPRVLAKGAGEIAQKIKEAGRAAGVPIVERRALARALFKSVKVGAEIPPALYRAVAEILAYIYSLRGLPAGEAR